MPLTAEQILALAPDAAAVAAGRKLALPGAWQGLGQSAQAVWGECQGSALYRVQADLGDLGTRCSCPSRKFPCKHALGLLLLAAQGALPSAEPPDWVAEWLGQRAQAAAKTEKRRDAPVDEEAQARRAVKRGERVLAGLDALDLWLADVAREGLASLEQRPAAFFAQAAARLVDAQAAGLAGRVRRLAERVGADSKWPEAVLDELGSLALLTHAFRRLETLPAGLQADLRQLVGFPLEKEEVVAHGDSIKDEWALIGQRQFDDERLRTQRMWLSGKTSGRQALVLQFAVGQAPFPEQLVAGTRLEATLAFWPSAHPQRALVQQRGATHPGLGARLPGFAGIEAFLDDVAGALGRQPWLGRTGAALREVTPLLEADERFLVRDASGAALELAGRDHWTLLALSGGQPLDLAGEWDGRRFHPMAALSEGEFHGLRSAP